MYGESKSVYTLSRGSLKTQRRLYMAQNNDDIPELVVKVEEMDVRDVGVVDCRRLIQLFYELTNSNSPHARRVQLILKRVMPRFTRGELKIQ